MQDGRQTAPRCFHAMNDKNDIDLGKITPVRKRITLDWPSANKIW